MKLALCGNPNVGKTTVFNRLTRSDAPVGNWHGVTVGVKSKRMRADKSVILTDLPGAYSLTARSRDEAVTRDEILYGDHDVIVYVAEVNNLRRNLYMFTQVLEAGKRAVLLVNMMDEARSPVDLKLLSARLGVPVIGTSDRFADPSKDILDEAARVLALPPQRVPYGKNEYTSEIKDSDGKLPPEFIAFKAMERDGEIMAHCRSCGKCAYIDRDVPSRLRYGFIDGALRGVTKRPKSGLTEKIDRVILGKAALPIFFLVMTAVFAITFEAGKPLSNLLGRLVESAARSASELSLPDWIKSLLCNGIISGIGAVLAFLPQVSLLFILTALLGDSGYMSRVAFATDGFFKKAGLSGRSAFSLILGLGCSATAVLSTRGISENSARKRTALVVPFLPCSARLAVFTAVCAYFSLNALVVAALYVLGFAAGYAVLRIMQAVGKQCETEELIMEMPPYRLPSFKRVVKVVFKNISSFLVRIGSTVFAVGIIMWTLSEFSFRYGFTGGVETSIMSTVAGFIAPVFKPLGFGNWRAVTALISGVAAKETVISVISSLGGYDAVFGSTAAAVSFLIFTCLYVPCAATLAMLHKEFGFKYVLISVAGHTVAAYMCSLAFYGSVVLYSRNLRLLITLWTCVLTAAAACIIALRIRKKHKAQQG